MIETIALIISVGAVAASLAEGLSRWYRKSDSAKITIETPKGKIKLDGSTQEKVDQIIKLLAEIEGGKNEDKNPK